MANSVPPTQFFIQKDIPPQTQAELVDAITRMGGRVESKVPRAGFILTLPGSPEEERLRLCWLTADRPERYFVPWTYVEACRVAGSMLKQIFIQNGEPIKFHIHPSIANVNARTALAQRIQHSGGDPNATQQDARVILADPNTEVFDHLVKTYQGVPEKYIESYLWVKKCVDKGGVYYTPLVYKNPGGRRPGEERTQFNDEDEEHLCRWIAAKIPYKETGGRTGNRLYQQLVELSSDPEYAWVQRHTWQSWRERYKKNADRLDAMIATIVAETKPQLGEKGQYGYVRMPEEKPKRDRGRNDHGQPYPQAHLHPAPQDNPHIPVLPHPPPSPPHLPHLPPIRQFDSAVDYLNLPVLPPNGPNAVNGDNGVNGMNSNIQAHENREQGNIDPNLDQNQEGANAAPAINGNGEYDSDFPAIRIGTAPPPPWALQKRRYSDGSEDEERAKRYRANDAASSGKCMLRANSPRSFPNGPLHVVDQAIMDIAKESRFTVEEVQEFYDKTGQMEATRERFMNMRKKLLELFG
ncbi:hypothetical protein GLOTRDRAFT_102548 [Gloeophyllum trabeum ATCC 11539]|uniref:DNA-binding protein RAP1 n=1 Tax=Gloeophyllum trabeum (strain ATCC 11539 / FP-39264 / Madison 617) TaxID=670483 RepID=S7QMX3_GLOTA|nr:uncharacterized protein GLOTRDRAFT_102548 [Gloeophyllum trabeum ATCC 11539]EPQ60843.1 hypothetical protein GLOTRDRAFT_102548 [Gloeophyllum trabeum ATCC 11539]